MAEELRQGGRFRVRDRPWDNPSTGTGSRRWSAAFWLQHQEDFRAAVLDVVRCGGDTDTTAAILGGIVGARVGKRGIPQGWLDGLMEWPRTVAWMEALGRRLARASSQGDRQRALSLPLSGLPLRNLFFLIVVLLHGFRRLLPPY